jgi:hypothetical protein
VEADRPARRPVIIEPGSAAATASGSRPTNRDDASRVCCRVVDLIRIRIQHFCSIRIQAKTELSKTISFSNFVEIKILS